jgi:uncharacterized protein with FMN-binding domain
MNYDEISMKKYILTFLIIGTFGLYILYQRVGKSADVAVVSNSQNIISNIPIPDTINTRVVSPTTIKKTIVKSTLISKPSGQYIDGVYTGVSADAYYGNIKVQAIISAGKLTDVKFLDYPSDRSTSRSINRQAMPYLKSEAITAQSAKVNTVSGATDSSGAFRQSLSSALSKAKNS